MKRWKTWVRKNQFAIKLEAGILLTIIVLTYLITHVVWFNGTVAGKSMEPNFYKGDHYFASQTATIRRGDIVVINPPGSSQQKLFIKRVIALPHDQISSHDDTTYINHHAIAEPYLDPYKARLRPGMLITKNFTLHELFGIRRVPQNSYFVMGDNRRQSVDSRHFNAVNRRDIIGVVKLRFWPLNRWSIY